MKHLAQVAVVTLVGLSACAGKSQSADATPEPRLDADTGKSTDAVAGKSAEPAGESSSGGEASMPPSAAGSSAAGSSAAGSSAAGSSAAGSSPVVGGGCAAVCVPTAHLVVADSVSLEELRTSSFEACRNDECHQGAFPPNSGGNTLSLTGDSGDKTSVNLFYDGDSQLLSLHLVWSLAISSTDFHDGDRYLLKATSPSGNVSIVIDTSISYEHYDFCAGPCTRAYVPDLVRVDGNGAGGAAGLAGAASE
jgi:hypothetical protein